MTHFFGVSLEYTLFGHLSHLPVERRRLHVQPTLGFDCRDLAVSPQGDDLGEILALDGLAAFVYAGSLRKLDSLPLALSDVIALQLGNGGKDGQHELAGWRGGVDRLLLRHELHALHRQLLGQFQQIRGVPREALNRLDDHGIAAPDKAHHLLQLRAVCVLAAHPVDVDLIDAQLLHQRFLTRGVLLGAADADIADLHCARSRTGN